MKVNKSVYLFAFLMLVSVCITGCKKNKSEKIIFDNSYPLALAPDVEWAVIIEPYAVFKVENEWDAATAGHCRKGEILQVKGKSITSTNESWYYFDGGWLPQNCVSIFSNRYKAEAVSKTITE